MGTPTPPRSEPPPEAPPEPPLNAERRIFRIIREAPGVHVREIERRAGVAYGAVDYHLRRLEERGLIRSEASEQLKVFFTTEFPREDRTLAASIRSDPARRILLALLSLKELNHGDLASATGLGLSTVSHHAKRLVTKGIVAARDEGRHTLFTLAEPARVERILIRHGHSVGDGALDAYITIWTEFRRPRGAKDPGPPEGPTQPLTSPP